MELQILRTLGVADILLDLLAHGPSQKVDYRRRTGLAPSTLMRAHEILFSAGYIETEHDPKRVLFKLSENGREIAELIQEIIHNGTSAPSATNSP